MSPRRNHKLGSSQLRAKRRRRFLVRFYIILFFILVVVFGLAIFSGHDKMIIKDIEVRGNDSVPQAQILEVVNKNLAGRYLGLFARKNFLVFPRLQIKKDLLNEIKTIKAVNLSWEKWQVVSVTVTERSPFAVWCGESKEQESDCYFMDSVGYIYNKAPVFSGNIFIKNYGVLPSTNPINQYFLPNRYQTISSLIDLLGQKNLEIIGVDFDGFDFTFYLKAGPKIIFNDRNGGFVTSFENLFIALESGNLDLIKDAPTIDYVDLRFDSKIVIGKKEI